MLVAAIVISGLLYPPRESAILSDRTPSAADGRELKACLSGDREAIEPNEICGCSFMTQLGAGYLDLP